MEYGYTLMSEEHGPKELVEIARRSEQSGFDFLVQSDHMHPWVPEQKHSPNAWVTLGAVAAATSTIAIQTFVTCPIIRYHPVIVAQQAATLACLSDNRFTLSLGSGERLNEHVVGAGWPPVDVRHEMLVEAIEIFELLWTEGYHSYRGEYFTVEHAQIFDLPSQPIPLAIAASGRESVALAIEHAAELVATEPSQELVTTFKSGRPAGSHSLATGQMPVCWGPDEASALDVAHRQFRWASLGWKVQSELPNPINFDAAAKTVRPEDLAEMIPHGPDPEPYVAAARKWEDAGFDKLAFVQVGHDQSGFFEFWNDVLQPALR